MILIISTIERFKFEIGLYDKKLEVLEFETKNQSDELLPKIEKTLQCKKIFLQNIDSILVNIGPGSYTGVRVGVTMANALAWSLNIPIYGFINGELEKELVNTKNMKTKFASPVLPYYSK